MEEKNNVKKGPGPKFKNCDNLFLEEKEMKIAKERDAEKSEYASTSSVLDYSMVLNEKNIDFCINTITGRYPTEGYYSNLECEELCYILEGRGSISKKENEPIKFEKGDIIYIDKKEIYFWNGNFKLAVVCTPAWTREQCKLYAEE